MLSKCHCHPYIGPFILISLLILSYHIYLIGFCFTIEMTTEELLPCLIIFNLLFFMTIWSLLYAMFEPMAVPPKVYRLTEDEQILYNECADAEKNYMLLEVFDTRHITLKTRTLHGSLRYCKICKLLKPDRAHHCATCGVCVLKMDHHCPWFNNCIGYSNHKPFLLCLLYSTLHCIFTMSTTYLPFSNYWQPATRKNPQVFAVVVFFMAAILGSITGIFFCFHAMLLFKNKTTIEYLSDPSTFASRNHTFDLGLYRNLTEVLGKNWLTWFVPGFSSDGDGCYFESRKILTRHGSHVSLASRLSRISVWSHVEVVDSKQTCSTFRMHEFDLPPFEKPVRRNRDIVLSIEDQRPSLEPIQ